MYLLQPKYGLEPNKWIVYCRYIDISIYCVLKTAVHKCSMIHIVFSKKTEQCKVYFSTGHSSLKDKFNGSLWKSYVFIYLKYQHWYHQYQSGCNMDYPSTCRMQVLQLTHHFIVFSALNVRANMANIMTDWRRKKLHYRCLLFCPLRSTSPCASVLIFQAEI